MCLTFEGFHDDYFYMIRLLFALVFTYSPINSLSLHLHIVLLVREVWLEIENQLD